jgi:hypothetical protein
MSEVRVLADDDKRILDEFLEERIDTSLFLLSNSDAAGLEDHGRPLQGTYAATFENGKMTAVAGHFWNGILIVQGDTVGVENAAQVAISRSGRALNGLIGPLALVERARRALGAETRRAKKDEPEILFSLDLEKCRQPTPPTPDRHNLAAAACGKQSATWQGDRLRNIKKRVGVPLGEEQLVLCGFEMR